jgi:hypothetical protein
MLDLRPQLGKRGNGTVHVHTRTHPLINFHLRNFETSVSIVHVLDTFEKQLSLMFLLRLRTFIVSIRLLRQVLTQILRGTWKATS